MWHRLSVLAVVLMAATAVGGVAMAAGSPSVSTGSASAVTQNSAQLRGTVNPNGSSTTYYFQWGLTTGYGDADPASSAGSGTKPVSVHQTAGHLIPGTVYHYRLVATNQFGTTVGADRTFRTAGAPPPGVSTGPATSLSTRGADLTGTVNPSGQTTSWYFQWGATTSYGQQTAPRSIAGSAPPTDVVASLQGILAPGTIFHYRLVATHGGAATTVGSDATFMTYPSPRPVPTVTASTRPRHAGHRPYVLTTEGRVLGPSSIPPQYACQGNVTIRFFRGLRQVRFTLAALTPACTFAAQTVFPTLPRHARAPVRLRVVIRFISTPYLATNRARYEHITLG